jgi:hypothetical protein
MLILKVSSSPSDARKQSLAVARFMGSNLPPPPEAGVKAEAALKIGPFVVICNKVPNRSYYVDYFQFFINP